MTSALAEVELPRALRRSDASLLSNVASTVARLARYDIDELVRTTAAAFPHPELRSLDAIHLATAHAVFGDRLTAFVCYDMRLFDAALALRLPVCAPGR